MDTQYEPERITADELLALLGSSPADNSEGYDTAVHWKSNLVGTYVKTLFQWKNLFDVISKEPLFYGIVSYWAQMQHDVLKTFITDSIKEKAEKMVRDGLCPDIFMVENERIESEYAQKIYDLCKAFSNGDGTLDMKYAREFTRSAEGKSFLKEKILEFAELEHAYNSKGLTRLKALRELMTTFLIVVTETPTKGKLPFNHSSKGGNSPSFQDYSLELKQRLENLYQANAFDIVKFAERKTNGNIGFSKYKIVKGSEIHSASLRHYPLPKGIKSNGKILYMPSPLINRPEVYDLGEDNSVIVGMHRMGYEIYMVDNGDPGFDESKLDLNFYCKIIHDQYLDTIKRKHPEKEIHIMAYCMAGTLMLPYLARRVEEQMHRGDPIDIKKLAVMASPVKFDDGNSGHKPMRDLIRQQFDFALMKEMYGDVNVPSQVIEIGMQAIQPGVRYTVTNGFFMRALYPAAIQEVTPFIYWLTHGTKFPARAHRQWLRKFFLGDHLYTKKFRLSSSIPELDGQPVNLDALCNAEVVILDYRGQRDPIAPPGSCIASELWGKHPGCCQVTSEQGLNRTIERNIGHIFVVSKKLLSEFLSTVESFYFDGEATAVG